MYLMAIISIAEIVRAKNDHLFGLIYIVYVVEE
jgi:hypothetical protein